MAVALSQGGSGFPVFAPCVFEYLKGTLIQDIKVTIGEVADWETRVFELLYLGYRQALSQLHCILYICAHLPQKYNSSQQKVMLLSSKP